MTPLYQLPSTPRTDRTYRLPSTTTCHTMVGVRIDMSWRRPATRISPIRSRSLSSCAVQVLMWCCSFRSDVVRRRGRERGWSAAALFWPEFVIAVAVVGGVDGHAGGDDVVDAVEHVGRQYDVGGGEERFELFDGARA